MSGPGIGLKRDVGRIVNPLTLHGQVIGGMVQGLGGAFLEHFVYDANGQLLSGNLADYLIPTATDFPKIRAIALENPPVTEQPARRQGRRRASAAATYLRPAKKRPNLQIVTTALVHRVVFDGKRAVGVEFSRQSGVERVDAVHEVILSAGAVGSPHLLQSSGVGGRGAAEGGDRGAAREQRGEIRRDDRGFV